MPVKQLAVIFILICQSSYGQKIGSLEISDSDLTPWKSDEKEEYQNVYHFGESEQESDLLILLEMNRIYAQIKSGSFSEDGKSFIWDYKNLTNVKIEGNKFYSDQTNGEFVVYQNGEEKLKGLKVFEPWSGLTEKGEYEVGTVSYSVHDYYSGKYPKASLQLLNRAELSKMSDSELRIMRNEIFARYGYIFKSGGEIEKYFQSQDWYKGQHRNVDRFLTELEKENIRLIQKIENE